MGGVLGIEPRALNLSKSSTTKPHLQASSFFSDHILVVTFSNIHTMHLNQIHPPYDHLLCTTPLYLLPYPQQSSFYFHVFFLPSTRQHDVCFSESGFLDEWMSSTFIHSSEIGKFQKCDKTA